MHLFFQMGRWLKCFVLLGIFGLAKSHYFIRLVILATLGLAGLWMVHTLAQDFNLIQSIDSQNRNIFKRSIGQEHKQLPAINWALVLSRDPASCARSFICQLAATEPIKLTKDEKTMLRLVK